MAELKSNEWTAPFETSQRTVTLRNGKKRIVQHAKAAGCVRNIAVTPELNAKYLKALAALMD